MTICARRRIWSTYRPYMTSRRPRYVLTHRHTVNANTTNKPHLHTIAGGGVAKRGGRVEGSGAGEPSRVARVAVAGDESPCFTHPYTPSLRRPLCGRRPPFVSTHSYLPPSPLSPYPYPRQIYAVQANSTMRDEAIERLRREVRGGQK